MNDSPSSKRIPRVLELFSGIGGMRFAFSYAGIPSSFFAIDINDSANAVYRHNFDSFSAAEGQAPNENSLITKKIKGKSRNHVDALRLDEKNRIIAMDISKLDSTFFKREGRFDIWTLSPPCQPYTRQSKALDIMDRRAEPLINIIRLLRDHLTDEMLPQAFVLENVKNFETSESFSMLLNALKCRGFSSIRSFLLSPTQLGFPNERLRFYLIAKRELHVPSPHEIAKDGTISGKRYNVMFSEIREELPPKDLVTKLDLKSFYIPSVLTFLDKNVCEVLSKGRETLPASKIVWNPHLHTSNNSMEPSNQWSAAMPNPGPSSSAAIESSAIMANMFNQRNSVLSESEASLLTSSEKSLTPFLELLVPNKVFSKSSCVCFDILSPSESEYHCCHSYAGSSLSCKVESQSNTHNGMCNTSCFTSGYGSYIEGTGSLVLLEELEKMEPDLELRNDLPGKCSVVDVSPNCIPPNLTSSMESPGKSAASTLSQSLFCEAKAELELELPPLKQKLERSDAEWRSRMQRFIGNVRYFSPEEVARLMGFKMPCASPEAKIRDYGYSNRLWDFTREDHMCLPVPGVPLCGKIPKVGEASVSTSVTFRKEVGGHRDPCPNVRGGKNERDPSFLNGERDRNRDKDEQESGNRADCRLTRSGYDYPCTCKSFSFPEGLTLRKRWKLIGNSLNPQVVGYLLRLCQIHELHGFSGGVAA